MCTGGRTWTRAWSSAGRSFLDALGPILGAVLGDTLGIVLGEELGVVLGAALGDKLGVVLGDSLLSTKSSSKCYSPST
jgi:hypothetical protein